MQRGRGRHGSGAGALRLGVEGCGVAVVTTAAGSQTRSGREPRRGMEMEMACWVLRRAGEPTLSWSRAQARTLAKAPPAAAAARQARERTRERRPANAAGYWETGGWAQQGQDMPESRQRRRDRDRGRDVGRGDDVGMGCYHLCEEHRALHQLAVIRARAEGQGPFPARHTRTHALSHINTHSAHTRRESPCG